MEPEITALGTPQNLEIQPRFYDIKVNDTDNSFAEMLGNAIQNMDNSIKDSERGMQNFITGQSDNIHEVMISMQEAQLSFQMMVEVRNKLVDTYKELSRMQI